MAHEQNSVCRSPVGPQDITNQHTHIHMYTNMWKLVVTIHLLQEWQVLKLLFSGPGIKAQEMTLCLFHCCAEE